MTTISTEWQSVPVRDGGDMRLFTAKPAASNAPGVIVLQEAFGVNHHIQDVTQRIAALGYLAVAPELFHRTAPGFEGDYTDISKSMPHMNALTNAQMEADLQASHDWLNTNGAGAVAAVGFCLGGKVAFIANAVLPLTTAVSFYGSGIPSLLGDYASRQRAPLTLIWGGKDKHIDAGKRGEVSEALRKAGKPYTQVEFSEADHGFFCDERTAYHSEAASESWALLQAILVNRFKK